eukprot:jgi/Mesvir1/11143/Mv04585-RA.1
MDQLTELRVIAERSGLTLQLKRDATEMERLEAERKKTEMDLRLHEADYRLKALDKLAALQEAVERHRILRISDRDRLFLQDKVNDILHTNVEMRDESGVPRKTLEISTVAREMGYRVNSDDLAKIGKVMAAKWRARFPGKAIPTYEKNVNGTVRHVNWYEDVPVNREMMEESIREVMGEPSSRPEKQRRLC